MSPVILPTLPRKIMKRDYAAAMTFFVFIIFFLFGAFISNFLSELVSKKHPNLHHVIPISIEITILIGVAIFGVQTELGSNEGKMGGFFDAFCYGNAKRFGNKISKSTVRTTRLTGLFTDLGIELSQLFFYKKPEERKRLKKSIYLRLSIIAFFFIGCISGGFIYNALQLKTLFVGGNFLIDSTII